MSDAPPAPRAGNPNAGRRRVLIVEDDTFVGLGLRAQLEKLGHMVVGQASDSSQATAMYDEHSPDLVMMDIRLAETDGIELSSKLLAKRRCPIVIISAYSDDELHTRAAAA